MLDRLGFTTLQLGLLLLWALFLTLVVLTNVTDALKHLGVLPGWWTLASGNYGMVVTTTSAHGIPGGVAAVLFAGVIAWEGLAAWMFFRAWATFRRTGDGRAPEVTAAFTVSLALWGAFLLTDEALIAYAFAPSHARILIGQLLSLFVVRAERGVAGASAAARR
jgi:hypothetical protein